MFCSIHRYSDKHQCDFDYKVVRMSPKLIAHCSIVFVKKHVFFYEKKHNMYDCVCDAILLQALGAEEITRSNPVVVAQKVAKI